VLKMCWYWSCRINLEYTKILIKNYLIRHGELWRIIDRPKVGLVSEEAQKAVQRGAILLGTQMTPRLNVYGINLIKNMLREELELLLLPRTVEQLLGYNKAEKTKFDLVAALQHCEIYDEDLLDAIPQEVNTKPVERQDVGYYRDERGRKKFGVIPKKTSVAAQVGHKGPTPNISYYDAQGQPQYVQPLSAQTVGTR
jgi:hypothetical protein